MGDRNPTITSIWCFAFIVLAPQELADCTTRELLRCEHYNKYPDLATPIAHIYQSPIKKVILSMPES